MHPPQCDKIALSFRSLSSGKLGRIIGFASAVLLTATATAQGIGSVASMAVNAVHSAKKKVKHNRPVHAPAYTKAPHAVWRGPHPGKDKGRGMWGKTALSALGYQGLEASLAMFVGPHPEAVEAAPGSSLPWEGSAPTNSGTINTGNGDKLTSIPLFSWKEQGGRSVGLTLYQNSETTYNAELGYGWTWTFDDYLNINGGTVTMHYGNGLAIPFTGTGSSFKPPTGIHDSLVQNSDSTYTLTKLDGTKYYFNSLGYCTSISDRNGNTVSFTLNSNYYVTKVTDQTGRSYSFSLNAGNEYTSVTSPSGQTWNFTYSPNGDLASIAWPAVNGNGFADSFGYVSHEITSHTDRNGNIWAYSYNSDGSLASAKDPLNNVTSYSYSSTSTSVTDPLGKVSTDNYSSGLLASHVDRAGFSNGMTYDASYNVSAYEDENGDISHYTYDGNGNTLTRSDPRAAFTYRRAANLQLGLAMASSSRQGNNG